MTRGLWQFEYGIHGSRAEGFMESAIEEMLADARGLTGFDEPPIPLLQIRAACVRVCLETFDRLTSKSSTTTKGGGNADG